MVGHAREKREEERVSAVMPVILENASGLTCDVSASGMFFETSVALAIGDSIDFSVQFDTPAGRKILKCQGKIIRTVTRDDRLGVAVKILGSTMEADLTWREREAASR